MYKLIIVGVLLALVAILLIVVVLLQTPKDDGGSMLGGNSKAYQLVGNAGMPHFLSKLTYILLIALFLLTLLFTSFLYEHFNNDISDILNDVSI